MTIIETLPSRTQTALAKAGLTTDSSVLIALEDDTIESIHGIGNSSIVAIKSAYNLAQMVTTISQSVSIKRKIEKRKKKGCGCKK